MSRLTGPTILAVNSINTYNKTLNGYVGEEGIMAGVTRGGPSSGDVSLPVISPQEVSRDGQMGDHSVRQLPKKQHAISSEEAKVSSISRELSPVGATSVRLHEGIENHHFRQELEKTLSERRVEEARSSVAEQEPDIETVKRWMSVKSSFEASISGLAACVPEGRAAYVRLVIPENAETLIGGKLEFQKGCTGLHGKGEEIGDNTLANIGSSGKPITCILAAVLEHQGHLRFTDSICRYFPSEVMEKFQEDCYGTTVDASKITVDMLAHMTAGLAYTGLAGIEGSTPEERACLTYDELLRKSTGKHSIPFTSRPGDKMCNYSNLQMQLLSYVIEKSYKEKAIRNLVEQRVALANMPVASFLREESPDMQKIPQDMTLKQFVDLVSDNNRQNSYIHNVYVYDAIDQILEKEAPSDAHCSFESILQKEVFYPLGITEATYDPSGRVVRKEEFLQCPLWAMCLLPITQETELVRSI
jgi:hypothetical protein